MSITSSQIQRWCFVCVVWLSTTQRYSIYNNIKQWYLLLGLFRVQYWHQQIISIFSWKVTRWLTLINYQHRIHHGILWLTLNQLYTNVQGSVTSLCVFEIQLKLNDAALRIEVNINALDLPSSPDAHVYSCLQEHITKLQVKWLHNVRLLISTFWYCSDCVIFSMLWLKGFAQTSLNWCPVNHYSRLNDAILKYIIPFCYFFMQYSFCPNCLYRLFQKA